MAHVVGVPRRDPCQKCKLPVFLAERLTVGKKVYHRTCLKCARCGYQLTPGSFYETEVDDEFCCETCPDEEELDTESPTADSSVQLRHVHQSASVESPVISPPRSRSVRSSIADRLAFFEQSKAVGGGVETASSVAGAKLLQKSLSDEEKTKSLQKIEASSTVTTPKTTPYKMNSAFSSFLNNTIDAGADVEEPDDTTSEATSSAAETPSVSLRSQNLRSISSHQMETSDSEDVDDLSLENRAPELPKSQPPPPSDAPREQPGAAPEDQNREQTRKFTSTAQLQLSSKWTADAPQDLPHEPQPQEPHDERSAGSGGDAEGKPLVEQTRTKKTEVQLNLFAGPTTDTVTTSAVIGAKDGNANIDSNSCNSDKENNKADDTILIPTTIQDDEIKYMDDDNEEDDDVDNSDDANDVQAKLEPRKPNDNNCVTKEETPENDAQQTRLEAPPNVAATDCAEVTTTLATTSVMEVESEEQKSPKLEAEASPVELRPKTTSNEDTEVTVSRDQNQLHHDHLHPGVEDVETTKRLSVVRARLHQFEVIANNVPDLDKDNANHNNRIGETNDSPSRSPIHKPDAEAESPTEHPTAATTIGEEVDDQKQETIEEITDNVKETDKSLNQVPTKEVVNEQHDGGDGEKVVKVEVEVDVVLKKDNNEHIDIKSVEMPMELGEERGGEQREDNKEEPINVDQPEETAPKVAAAVEKVTPATTPGKLQINEYPEDLNPFQSDDDDAEEEGGAQDVDANKENILRSHLSPTPRSLNVSSAHSSTPKTAEKSYKQSLNPFDSSDDEVELEKSGLSSATSTPSTKVPPPRPPPPRISRNPFGEENDDSNSSFSRRSSLSSSLTRKTPVPTPRSNVSQSQNPTPEPTPRLGNKSQPHLHQSQQSPALQNSSDYYGSANSLGSTPQHSGHGHGLGLGIGLYRNSDVRGSNNSLTSSAGGTIRSRKQRRAPAPPSHPPVKELFPSAVETATGTGHSTTTTTSSTTEGSSKASTPSSSTVGTPRQGRKKRPAPAPPKPARLDPALLPTIAVHDSPTTTTTSMTTQPKNLLSYPLQADLDSKLSDEEKALLEGNLLLRQQALHSSNNNNNNTINEDDDLASRRSSRRVIPLDASLLEDEGGKCDDIKHREHEEEMNVVYRRILVPPMLETPTHDSNPLLDHLNESHDRQLEKLKDNKEAKNRNRQSQISASSGAEDSDPTLYNKSAHGKWKRRKGPAPALPIPPRKVLQMLPLQEIKHELEIIEVQQQGLEKQGVVLEKMIRDRCEGENGEPLASGPDDVTDGGKSGENSKEVEDLILQLFELVNEKNELFRRQAELMYLRRQHRLEQEQADLEYEIRVLMAQPERNKTDSDKAREEALIARLVDVVQLRNEVIECLEMDRLREAEEDMSIKRRLELHTAQREVDDGTKAPSVTKLSKKEKKKQKETKKLGKSKKLDADKDADESELNSDKQKAKKKKKKFIF